MKRPFHIWTDDNQACWRTLAQRQLRNMHNHASHIWLDGWSKLEMSQEKIPDFQNLSQKLERISNWELMSSPLGFADGQAWFETLARNEFLVTEYIRPTNSLDFTPLPDIFHDAFGHLPFLVDADFSRIVQLFTTAILRADKRTRVKLGHWWWYSIEFGLVKEAGETKILGAGLASSLGELTQVFSGKTKLQSFDPEIVGKTSESHSKFHQTLFVLESLSELETLIKPYAS